MQPCALNMTVSALACAIAEGKNAEELALLSCFFVQLGDSLATIQASQICNEKCCAALTEQSKEVQQTADEDIHN